MKREKSRFDGSNGEGRSLQKERLPGLCETHIVSSPIKVHLGLLFRTLIYWTSGKIDFITRPLVWVCACKEVKYRDIDLGQE